MKVEAECAACLLSRGIAEAKEATDNPALHFRAAAEIVNLLKREFKPSAVPAVLGTKRDRIIRRVTGCSDPYRRTKQICNQNALKMLPYARKLVEEGYRLYDRFRRACLCSIVGNIMEFDIPGHNFTFSKMKKLLLEAGEDLAVDDIPRIYELAEKSKSVLLLADNAGEIVFDTLLVEQLKSIGLSVYVAVKGGPVINDATMEDAEASNMVEIADKVITTGTDAVGLILEEASPEFLSIYASVDLVIAKGMGYAETLTEYKLNKPHALLFRTKCEPVANFFGVFRDRNVAKLMMP
ncbi:MAG: ARMT1-like domain-containing protein [Candidatus Bathyarchaeota archaeon]|nr:ARMT1-like domain-containing protein [Candidatus Bathyarchaeota archaeon]MCX8177234.1 ARMT1-like domain-containing protein [Candidatus Bathyarchaeota archaeon]MDW8193523.1 ARMT1-like domain-containing protein [Nitrososphaerota archaeon]